MPFNPLTGIITEPLNTRDIGLAIGSSSDDIGTLCAHDNINKWSKHKPIRHPKNDKLTEAERQSKNYGLEYIPYYTSLKNLGLDIIDNAIGKRAANADTSRTPWEYLKPRGKEYNEILRMPDYDGYINRDNGGEFIGIPEAKEETVMPGMRLELIAKIGKQTSYNIQASDIKAITSSGVAQGMNYIGIGYLMGATVLTVKCTMRIDSMVEGAYVEIASANFKNDDLASTTWETRMMVVMSKDPIDKEYQTFGQQSDDVTGLFIPVYPTYISRQITIYKTYTDIVPSVGWGDIPVMVSGVEKSGGISFMFSLIYNADFNHNITITAYYKDGSKWAETSMNLTLYLPSPESVEGYSDVIVFLRNLDDSGNINPRGYYMLVDDPLQSEFEIELTSGAIKNGEPFMRAAKEAEYILIHDSYGLEGGIRQEKQVEIWPID